MTTTTANIVHWEPAELFNDPPETDRKAFALVILNVPLENLTVVKKLARSAEYCIAADGAANRIFDSYNDSNQFRDQVWQDFRLKTIIGDMDSIKPDVQSQFLNLPNPPEIVQKPSQYSTDFTKAVVYVTEHYSHLSIVVTGSLYGRVDHAMSQLHHLFMFTSSGSLPMDNKIFLITDASINWVLEPGFRHVIHAQSKKHRVLNKHIGIIPLQGLSKITTKGLEWDVSEWSTQVGGEVSTSNRVSDDTQDGLVHIETDKDVLFTIDMVENARFHIDG